MRFRLTFALTVLVGVAMTASPSFAQPTTWQNIGSDWGTGANWSAGVPNSATSIAIFGPQAAPVQPNIAAVFTVQQATFDTSLAVWNLTGTGANLLRVGSGGIIWSGGAVSNISANIQITSAQTWNVGTTLVSVGGAVNAGALYGTSPLTINGVGGDLTLDSAGGLFTGGFNVNAGVLRAGAATNNAASQVLRSNFVNLASSTFLTTTGATIDLRVGSLSGSGSVTPAVGGAINVLALTNSTFSGVINTTGGLNLRGGGGTAQALTGDLTALTGTIGINSGATLSLSGTGDSVSGVLGSVAIAPRGGAFVLDNTAGNTSAVTGRINDVAAFTFVGGTVSLVGNSAGTTETVGGLTLNSGSATISVTHNGGGGGTVLAFTDTGSLRDSTAMTVNFEGIGGTLGTAGANPRITFSGALNANTVNGALTSTVSGPGSVTYGWARVNGTSWAGNGANGIVALAEVARDSTTLGAAAINEITTFTPSATTTTLAGNLGVAATSLLVKITPSAAGQNLDTGGFNINASALMLAGNTDFSITGAGSIFGTVASTRYVYVTDANTVLSVAPSFAGANQPFGKSGAGTVFLNGASNQLNFTTVQNVNIVEGTLRGTLTSLGGGTSAGGAFANLNLYGGVLEISGGGTFSRALNVAAAAGGGSVKWDGGGTARGDGGFSAIGGDATVTLVTALGGATPAPLVWNTGGFASNGYALLLGSTKADSRIDLTNDVALDSGAATNNYFGREVRVAKNVASNTDIARLSGAVTGSFNADLLKTGAGTLELTGNANTYAGNTQVLQGSLRANNVSGSATGTGNVLVRSGATLGGSGFIVPNNAGGNQVAIAGKVSPGNSVGTLTIGSGLSPATVTATGSYDFELSTAGTPAALDTGGSSILGVHDVVTIFGSLDVSGLVINPMSLGVTGFNNTQSYSWTVATATGGVTGTPGIVTLGSGIDFAGMSFLTSVVGNSVYLNFTPVPEPATVLSIAAVGFGVGGLIRRRFRKSPTA